LGNAQNISLPRLEQTRVAADWGRLATFLPRQGPRYYSNWLEFKPRTEVFADTVGRVGSRTARY